MKRAQIIIILSLFVLGCFEDGFEPSGGFEEPYDPEWLVNRLLIFDGGPGKDGIRSIDDPVFIPLNEMDHLLDNEDLIIGFQTGQTVRAYPHKILDWHEIVNDQIDEQYFAINYCPLTGTGMSWNRRLRSGTTTFGVSGLIYKTNLIPYDRVTDSEWSQMMMKSIHGLNKKEDAELYPVLETTWRTWKSIYPESKVLSDITGIDLPYDEYPYGDYKEQEHRFLFGDLSPIDMRLPLKERVFGIRINNKIKVYRFNSFKNGTVLIKDSFHNVELAIVGNKEKNFIVGFEAATENGTRLELEKSVQDLPAILQDVEGNTWDIFGVAISGPRAGQKLKYHPSLIGYWFTFGSFYPNPEIYRF